jgi:adenylylsulfate kinase
VTGAVVWLTGLPASGKSTLARALARRLRDDGREPLLLDGDELRAALVPAPGYHDEARDGFYRTLGNLACLAAGQGIAVIVAATAHRRTWRDRLRDRVPRFVEVHVATTADECRRRDPKGLYARAGPGSTLPGAGVEYEPPIAPEVVVSPGGEDAAIEQVLLALADRHTSS